VVPDVAEPVPPGRTPSVWVCGIQYGAHRNPADLRHPRPSRRRSPPSGRRGAGFWLQVATDGINQHGLSEREATHLYALVSATIYDALIACWDAKQTYWYIRPWQADPLITTTAAVGKPNHPSYTSGHSCVSSSGAEVISTFFPEQRAQSEAWVVEAGLSRMYGGIHYRFDIDAGQALGRNVAHFAIAQDASGNSVLTAR
jgi:hypothetical protein